MIQFALYRNYLKETHNFQILIINAYIGANKDMQNGISIKEV